MEQFSILLAGTFSASETARDCESGLFWVDSLIYRFKRNIYRQYDATYTARIKHQIFNLSPLMAFNFTKNK